MTKITDNKSMKYAFWLVLLLFFVPSAWAGIYQHGTVVRMRMADCLPEHHGFISTFGPPAAPTGPELCPEYTLISDKVVFVIVGRSSGQLVPLADVVDFRFHNNELAVRIDDAKRESKFAIKEMVLRSEWDRMQKHLNNELDAADRKRRGRHCTASAKLERHLRRTQQEQGVAQLTFSSPFSSPSPCSFSWRHPL